MIPPNLTHGEVGHLLVAIGRQMCRHDLCFAAVLEDGHSHGELLAHLLDNLEGPDNGERAAQLLQLTGEDVISFVSLP